MIMGLLIALLIALILLGVPVAFALLVPSLIYLAMDDGAGIAIAVQQLTAGANSFPLLAIPMFILVGVLANSSGLTDKIFSFASLALGNLRGGLGYVNVATSFGFSWISGAAISDAAAMGKVVVPQMVKRGYSDRFSLGLTGVSSLIAPMVPPSIPAVVYAVTAGVSVSSMFVAGLVPALFITFALLVYVFIAARTTEKAASQMESDVVRPPLGKLGKEFLGLLPGLGAPIFILGGILGGITTPTEAAAAGALYMIILGVLYRQLTWKKFWDCLYEAAVTTGSIMTIVVAAALFGWVLGRERVPQTLAAQMSSLTDNPFVFMTLLVVVLLLLGMILEPTSAILILVPILAPMAGVYGIDPVHLGVVVILTLMVGLVTPPVGLVLFVLSSVTNYPVSRVVSGVIPFYLVLGAALLLITYVPLFYG